MFLYEKLTQKLEEETPDTLAEEHDALVQEINRTSYQIQHYDQIPYGHSVVNPGESLLCVGDTWTDLSDILVEQKNTEYPESDRRGRGKCQDELQYPVSQIPRSRL